LAGLDADAIVKKVLETLEAKVIFAKKS